jgi:hypothetical protein
LLVDLRREDFFERLRPSFVTAWRKRTVTLHGAAP